MHNPLSIAATTAATGAAPAPNLKLPDTGFLRQPQVLAFVPISKSTLWRRVQARTFPEPLKLSQRVTVWRAEDIRQWIDDQRGEARPGVVDPIAPRPAIAARHPPEEGTPRGSRPRPPTRRLAADAHAPEMQPQAQA